MRDSRRKACMLLLASAGLLPTQAQAALDGATRLEVVRSALAEARQRLELERFLLRKLEGIGDSGISPSYMAEVDSAKKRIFEARALVLALERLEGELAAAAAITQSIASPPKAPRAPSGLSRGSGVRRETSSSPARPSLPTAETRSPSRAQAVDPPPPEPDAPW